jgi:hypothetical protein
VYFSRNVAQLEVGTLQDGIRASNSNTGLAWSRTRENLAILLLTYLFCGELGKNNEKEKKNPQIRERDASLKDLELFKRLNGVNMHSCRSKFDLERLKFTF